MATKILDAYAIMAFFENEPGADYVRNLIIKAEEKKLKLLMSVVNLGEVWYSVARSYSPGTADTCIQEIEGMAIEIVNADWQQTLQAAQYKQNGGLAYADCFAAALAKSRKAELVTGDMEFLLLEDQIKIFWLGKGKENG
ncbi:MAG: type II toxin-antitoxin system VapC family toxin [Anaerolineales bacterium]|nr:type II toxin-antitoxin system VapC family toxin [Anaerolineales bacterium]